MGGSPESVIRAASYGLPLMIAIIGGESVGSPLRRPVPPGARPSSDAPTCPSACTRPGHIAETDELAREQLWPHYKRMRDRIGAERGWGPMSRAEFDQQAGTGGSLYVGSPETVATKIAPTARLLQLSRFDMKYSAGQLPHELLMTSIELYGTEVIPMVREILAATTPPSANRSGLRTGHA